MKTIFISIPYGMSARNILRSDALKIIQRDARVVILSPLSGDQSFIEEFQSENTVFRNLPHRLPAPFRLLRKFLDVAEGYFFTNKSKIRTLRILRDNLRREHPGLYFFRILVGILLGHRPVINLLRRIQLILIRSKYYDDLFEEFKPSMVFLTHLMTIEEFPLALYGRQRRIAVLGMPHSWDVVSTKTGIGVAISANSGRLPPLKFDQALVWNEIQKKELVDYWGYRPEEVLIVGVPQFDSYVLPLKATRDEFIRSLGGDPGKKTIAYLAGNPNMLPWQNEIVEMLVNWLKQGKFCQPIEIIVRLHPGLDTNNLLSYRGHSGVLIDEPSIAFSANRFFKGWDAAEKGNSLAQTIFFSDLVLNVLSTSSLDAAAFNKPVISIAFDGYQNRPYEHSILRYYDWTHYRRLLKTNGLRVARHPDQLLEQINQYLENSELDARGRAEMVRSHCYRLDGKAGERIGRFLLDQMDLYATGKAVVREGVALEGPNSPGVRSDDED